MRAAFLALVMALGAAQSAVSQTAASPDPAALIQAQAEAMQPLSWMKGRWRGEAWIAGRGGRHTFVQTERVGPMLDGSLLVIEGKSFETDGRPAPFNAFGVISYDPITKAYVMHSYAQGRAGDFPLEVTPNGWAWTLQASTMKIRYVTTFEGGVWREVGHAIRPDGGETQIFDMNLTRVGDTDWPMAGQATASPP